MTTSSNSTGKDQANLEDLTVIWVDEYSQDLNTRARLRCIINFLKVFTHIDNCIDYIQSVPNEHLFVIVSGQLSSQVIPVIQDLPQVLHVEMPDNLPLAIDCLCIMGQSYKNEPTLALQSFEQALELQLKYNQYDRKSLAPIYNNLGFAHRRLGSDKEIAPVVAQIYFYMGEWYEQMHQMHQAVEYYERAAELGMATLRPDHPTIKHYTNTFARKKTELLSMESSEEVSRL
ncbi:unnamed protein product [Rotaria sp. Silwood1]|nr:unnamed protein product [Rotaria sp. Silwood1]CAF4643066.1 unnamed protein product [Rotaria sp. Silwood1]CAF4701118.1 unnamed protein product [Rotaria sp. Silwood1]CAF4766893.1 unnamed protein product [Rotaria sp. Silwood1]